jgi:hypothetical protein
VTRGIDSGQLVRLRVASRELAARGDVFHDALGSAYVELAEQLSSTLASCGLDKEGRPHRAAVRGMANRRLYSRLVDAFRAECRAAARHTPDGSERLAPSVMDLAEQRARLDQVRLAMSGLSAGERPEASGSRGACDCAFAAAARWARDRTGEAVSLPSWRSARSHCAARGRIARANPRAYRR